MFTYEKNGYISFEPLENETIVHQAIDKALILIKSPILHRDVKDPLQRLELLKNVKSSVNSTTFNNDFTSKTISQIIELLALNFWNDEIDHTDTANFDAKLKTGKTIDFKGKRRDVPPWCVVKNEAMDCGVPYSQEGQQTDYYLFGQIKKDLSIGYFNGTILKERFMKSATNHPKGERQPNGIISAGYRKVFVTNLNRWSKYEFDNRVLIPKGK